jgi:hypothetical protein
MNPLINNSSVSKTHLGGLVASLFLLVFLVGCGGGDSPSTSALSKAEILELGEEICSGTNQEQAAAIRQLGREEEQEKLKHPNRKPTTIAERQETAVSEAGLPPMEKQAEQLSKLEASGEDEDTIEAITVAIEKAIADSEKEPEEAVKPAGENAFDEAAQLAREYGFKKCGAI